MDEAMVLQAVQNIPQKCRKLLYAKEIQALRDKGELTEKEAVSIALFGRSRALYHQGIELVNDPEIQRLVSLL